MARELNRMNGREFKYFIYFRTELMAQADKPFRLFRRSTSKARALAVRKRYNGSARYGTVKVQDRVGNVIHKSDS